MTRFQIFRSGVDLGATKTKKAVYLVLPADFYGQGDFSGYDTNAAFPERNTYYAIAATETPLGDFFYTDTEGLADTFFFGGNGDDQFVLGDVRTENVVVGGSGDDSTRFIVNTDKGSRIFGDFAEFPDIRDDTDWRIPPNPDTALTGNDTLRGSNGSDTIFGNGGDDVIYGSVGSDSLYGGDGADQIDAGPRGGGLDIVSGDGGADAFILRAAKAAETTGQLDTGDFWSVFDSNLSSTAGSVAKDEVKVAIGLATKSLATATFAALGGAVAGVVVSDLVDYLIDLTTHDKPKDPVSIPPTNIIRVLDFDPREDALFVPFDAETTITTSVEINAVRGPALRFIVDDGTYFAEAFFSDDFLTDIGFTSITSGRVPALDALVADTRVVIDEDGVVDTDAFDIVDGEAEIEQSLKTSPGTQTVVYAAFGPWAVTYSSSYGDTLYGTRFGDVLSANFGLFDPADYLENTNGTVRIGQTTLFGFGGDDVLYGASGQDNIFGGSGADEIHGYDDGGTLFADELHGGLGSDTLYVHRGAANFHGKDPDALDPPSDVDVLDFSYQTAGASVDIASGTGTSGYGKALTWTGIDRRRDHGLHVRGGLPGLPVKCPGSFRG